MHDNIRIYNGRLYISKIINGELYGYHELSPTLAYLAAKNTELDLFIGPEKHGIDFINRTPWVDKIPEDTDTKIRRLNTALLPT